MFLDIFSSDKKLHSGFDKSKIVHHAAVGRGNEMKGRLTNWVSEILGTFQWFLLSFSVV